MKKKLFISCPMRGRSVEAIQKTRVAMHKIAEVMLGEELEVIDSYIELDNFSALSKNESIYNLGKSIQKMSEADYFIGFRYPDGWRGCAIETGIAQDFGIRTILLNENECNFVNDAVELRRLEYERCDTTAEIVRC